MKNIRDRSNINYSILAFAVFQLMLVISLIVLSASYFSKDDKIEEGDYKTQPHIHIENLTGFIADSPAGYDDVIDALLLDIVQKNVPDINISEAKAEIRGGTAHSHYFERPNINYFSAIIDIPVIEQSYQLFYQYSNEEQNEFLSPNDSIIFLCIEDSLDIIYPDFDCKDIYSQKTRNAIAAKYLQFFKFGQFSAGINSKNYELVKIFPNNFNQVDDKAFLEEVKQAIQFLGISPELFDYYIIQPEDITYLIEP